MEPYLAGGASRASRFEDEYAGVIRFGQQAVSLLRALAERTTDHDIRAGAYIVIAAITGDLDVDMVSQLLDGDTEEVAIGATMIEGAGSRAWRDKLIEVLESRDASFGAAAHALVTCHLRDALAPLQAFRSNASLPQYALTELEAGLQRGEW